MEKKDDISDILQEIKAVVEDDKSSAENVLVLTELVEDNAKEDGLISPVVEKAVQNSITEVLRGRGNIFEKKQNNTITLEDFIINIIKPELTDWLNLNLEKVVKEVIEKEIQKILKK